MTNVEILLLMGCALAFYYLICNRVTAAMHPIRMRLLSVGNKILDSEDLSDYARRHVEASLDSAYSTAAAWGVAFLMPFAVASTVYDEIVGKRTDAMLGGVNPSLQSDAKLFCLLWFVSVVANSPIAAIIVVVELFVSLVLWLPVTKVLMHTARTVSNLEAKSIDFSRAHNWDALRS